MNILIKSYNKLVPTMNSLVREGYNVEAFHSSDEGYGFYTEGKNNHYTKVSIFYTADQIQYIITKYKHNSNYGHDILNDIKVNKAITTEPMIINKMIVEMLK